MVLIVVDGLRRDVLEGYLKIIEENDFEPEWPSGLAMLARDGFRLAHSSRAESPVPSYGMAAAATTATGQFPGASGIPGSAWYEASATGTLLGYDFESAQDASRIYFGLGMTLPEAGQPFHPLLAQMLRARTVYQRLAPQRRSTVVFHPIGEGAEWLVPSRAGAGVTAVMRHRAAAAVVPVFDRGTRNAAIDVILSETPPDLLTLYFSGISLSSCFQYNAVCDGTVGDLVTLQTEALKKIDAHLALIFGKLRDARARAFDRTTLLLVGTVGAVDRTTNGAADARHVLTPKALGDRLAENVVEDETCAAWLRDAPVSGEMVVAANGAAAHVYVRRPPRGGRAAWRGRMKCLGAALTHALGHETWLSGAAWTDPERLDLPLARGQQFQVRLGREFRRGLPARRRERLVRKIRLAVDLREASRSGDALVFLAPPWIFVPAGGVRAVPYVAQGGLEDAAMEIPFLIASPALSEPAASELRATPLELADVAPTILALLEAPAAAYKGLPRPPAVQWKRTAGPDEGNDRLEIFRADRQIPAPLPPQPPVLIWNDHDRACDFGLAEPDTVDEPDVVELRLGDASHRWTYDQGFPPGGPCRFDDTKGRRRWICTREIDREAPTILPFAARRTPSATRPAPPDGGSPPNDEFLVPVLIQLTGPTFGGSVPEVVCADESRVRVRLRARDTLGLERVALVLVDAASAADRQRTTASGYAAAPLGALEQSEGCAVNGPLSPDCGLHASAPATDSTVDVPFRVAQLRHSVKAMDLLADNVGDLAHLREVFEEEKPGGTARPPRRAYLALRVCNLTGRCVQRPLLSDRDYEDLVEQGCR